MRRLGEGGVEAGAGEAPAADAGSVRARADSGDVLALHADAFPGRAAKRSRANDPSAPGQPSSVSPPAQSSAQGAHRVCVQAATRAREARRPSLPQWMRPILAKTAPAVNALQDAVPVALPRAAFGCACGRSDSDLRRFRHMIRSASCPEPDVSPSTKGSLISRSANPTIASTRSRRLH